MSERLLPAGRGSSGPMIRVHSPPTTTSATMRVWIRPDNVGVIVEPLWTWPRCARRAAVTTSRREVPRPSPPLGDRPDRPDPGAEPLRREGVGDPQRRVLQPEEGVDTGVVA